MSTWLKRMPRRVVCILPMQVGFVALLRVTWRAVKLNCIADSVGLHAAGGVIWLRPGAQFARAGSPNPLPKGEGTKNLAMKTGRGMMPMRNSFCFNTLFHRGWKR